MDNTSTTSNTGTTRIYNQDMIIFRQCGYPPNDKNFLFVDGEATSGDRYIALRELNKLGIRVLQMEIGKSDFGSMSEWWLVEKEENSCNDVSENPKKDYLLIRDIVNSMSSESLRKELVRAGYDELGGLRIEDLQSMLEVEYYKFR